MSIPKKPKDSVTGGTKISIVAPKVTVVGNEDVSDEIGIRPPRGFSSARSEGEVHRLYKEKVIRRLKAFSPELAPGVEKVASELVEDIAYYISLSNKEGFTYDVNRLGDDEISIDVSFKENDIVVYVPKPPGSPYYQGFVSGTPFKQAWPTNNNLLQLGLDWLCGETYL